MPHCLQYKGIFYQCLGFWSPAWHFLDNFWVLWFTVRNVVRSEFTHPSFHPSIHPASILLVYEELWGSWSWSIKRQCTLWTGHQVVLGLTPKLTTIHTYRQIRVGLISHVFGLWKETHTDSWRPCVPHTEGPQLVSRFEPRALLLWGSSANHCTTLLPSSLINTCLYYKAFFLEAMMV